METDVKTFITQFEKDGENYEGPRIAAASWEEAQAEAARTIEIVGELAD
jgi:hypothetical protein